MSREHADRCVKCPHPKSAHQWAPVIGNHCTKCKGGLISHRWELRTRAALA